MKNLVFILFLSLLSFKSFSQETTTKSESVLYVVDDVPVIDEPQDGEGELKNEDVDHVTVITNRAEIDKLGYKTADKVVLVTTKAYTIRPDSLKRIITTKLMDKKEGVWYAKDATTPYTGRFIDYFFNGKKQGDGYFKNGVVDGMRTLYYPNGNKSYFRNYVNGIANGYSEEYFPNGKIKQKGVFKNGRDDGLWQEFYSTGNIKRESVFLNDKIQFKKDEEKFYTLLNKSVELMKEGDYKSAIKKNDDALKINTNYSNAYFYRGTANLENMDFDAAIIDFDKAISLEPLYMEALSNRAFARIRKYEFKNSRTLLKNSEVTVLAGGKDKAEIPKPDLDKVCADLNSSYELGDRKAMIVDAMKKYCK